MDSNNVKIGFNEVFNALDEGVAIVDTEHNIVRINDVFSKMMSVSKKDIVNKKCHEIIHSNKNIPSSCPCPTVFKTKKSSFTEFSNPDVGKNTFLLKAFPVLGNGGSVTHAVLQIRDISKQKKAYEELKTLDSMKTNLIANVSHELRTPITIASTAIELANEEEDPDERKRLLNMIYQALARQNLIVEDLLEAATFEYSGTKARPEPLDVYQEVKEVVKDYQQAADTRDINISLRIKESLPKVYMGGKHLRHVLRNLVGNAIKFSMAGGEIIIGARERKGKIEFCITDSGIGIPEVELEKIFDRFYQIDSSARRSHGGMGLGLAVAKKIVDTYNGEISVESEAEKGSKFCFTVPLYDKDAGGVR